MVVSTGERVFRIDDEAGFPESTVEKGRRIDPTGSQASIPNGTDLVPIHTFRHPGERRKRLATAERLVIHSQGKQDQDGSRRSPG
jgi:hypothetical protein